MQIKKDKLKKPNRFLASKITLVVSIVIVVLITLITAIMVYKFRSPIWSYKNQLVDDIIKSTKNIDYEILIPIGICFVLYGLMLVSYYVIRSAYNSIEESKTKLYIKNCAYFIANVYIAGLEFLMYGLVFSIGFTNSLPTSNDSEMSVLQYLTMPAVIGIAIIVGVYVILNFIALKLFEHFYGGLLILEELKLNRDIIDLLTNGLVIFTLLGTIVTINLNTYKFTDVETQWLFIAAMFTIAMYVIKTMKNFVIWYQEGKIK